MKQNLQRMSGVKVNGKLKVYMIPVISSSVIAEIDSSTEFTVVKEITNWTYIMAGDIQGWVRTYGIKGGEQQPSNVVGETEKNQNTEEPNTQVPEEKPEEPTTPEVKDNSGMGETAVDNQKGFVAVDYANIRKQASTSSEIVTTLTKDTSFTITAETEDWYKITYTGIDGTVYEGYIYKNLATK